MVNEASDVNAPGPIDEALRNSVAALPEVDHVSTARHLTLEDQQGLTHLTVYEFAPASYLGFHFLAGDPGKVWPEFDRQEAVIVSEPLATHRHLQPGQHITLRTDQGDHAFAIAGIYRDYSSDQGIVAMHRRTFAKYWHDAGYNSLGLYVAKTVTATQLRSAIAALPHGAELRVTSNRELREASLETFDRTFAITRVLRILAGLIAFVGVFSALMALQLDRSRELGVLRACGLTPAQLGITIVAETTLLGGIAGLLALPAGTAVAALLVHVINRQSFGWSMALRIDSGILLQGVLLALIAAVLAGCYPAWRMARTSPATALRSE
jgi:putative ABC transport system permease protein